MSDPDVVGLETARRTALSTVSALDLSALYDLDQQLDKDSSLRQQFIKDPMGVASSKVGFKTPPGFHMHWVDTNNNYNPPEGSAHDQLLKAPQGKKWIRVEVRVAGGLGGCIALCGVCT